MLEPRVSETLEWGVGDDSTEVFPELKPGGGDGLVTDRRAYEQAKFDASLGEVITWPEAYGGRALGLGYRAIFDEEEAKFQTPRWSELFGVTQALVAPTVERWGTTEQRERYVRAFLRCDLLACQLFSEPDAGSDLANVQTRAVRDGSDWVVNGQKIWTSGAQAAHFGELICRTDPDAAKHHGLSAFLVPLDAPGIDIRPIRQITGGSTFNEVFMTDVRLGDDLRIGGEGDGWKVALTTLGEERFVSGGAPLEKMRRVTSTAAHLGAAADPVTRQALADLYVHVLAQHYLESRVRAAISSGQTPGPEASLGKLLGALNAARISAVASRVLGPKLGADTGEWGTYSWNDHVLGATASRLAGGTDEIQRNIIGERVLGLPREPRPREVAQ